MKNPVLLSVRNYKQHFPINKSLTVHAVNGISFDLRKGEIFGPVSYTHLDSCALFVGGLAGTLFSGFIPKRVKETLPLIFGVITLCMGRCV